MTRVRSASCHRRGRLGSDARTIVASFTCSTVLACGAGQAEGREHRLVGEAESATTPW